MSKSDERLKEMGISEHSLFESLLERSPDKIYFKDADSRFVMVSRSMVRNFNVRRASDLIGKTDFDVFSEEHARQAHEDEQEVIRTGAPVFREAEKETWPDGTVTWASTIKAPIFDGDEKPIGVLGISRDVTREKLAHDALERHDRLLKDQNDVMRADLENARVVQGLLIPGPIRDSGLVKIAAAYEPSHGVSGDVITFPRPDERECRFFLGDVCGHGVSAGIYTILIKYLADRFSRGRDDRMHAVLARMNKALQDVMPNRFVTAVNGIFQRTEEGRIKLLVSHAAHPIFFLQRSGKDTETIRLEASPGLGLLPDSSFAISEFSLERGDRTIFFTDGLEEGLNETGEEFGLDRLTEAVRGSREQPLDGVPEHLLGEVASFTGKTPRVDDQTCLVFQVR